MRSYLKKASILALAVAANAKNYKRDPYWIKMSDVIQLARPDFYFGVATTKSFFKNPKYKDIISTFNLQVGGNECKFYTINGSETFNTKQCDDSIEFAKKFGAKYRGHNLFWPANSPDWFKDSGKDIEEVKEYILDYVAKVLDHYKDEEDIIYWDVINESVTDDSTPENIKLREGSDKSSEFKGWDTYTEDIFKVAREHTNKNVKLFYNDYNAEANNGSFDGKTGAVFNYIKSMKEKDIPIDGVGLQMHISCNYYPNYDQLYKLISQYEEIGVEVHVTEIDVSMEKCKTVEEQKKLYMDVFKACFDHKNCKVFTVWGAYDSESWKGAENAPLIFDEEMYPKEIYFDMLDYVLKQLPEDADYPKPTSTEKPTKSTPTPSAGGNKSEAKPNYIIKPEAYMIDPAWANWSWGVENVELDDEGNVVAVFEEEKYGAFSLHTDKTFNAGTLHFEAKIDKEGAPVKVIVHTTKGEEQVVMATLENVSTEKMESFDVPVTAAEGDTYNRVSIHDAWGKAITLTINNFYFTPGEASATEKPSESGAGATEKPSGKANYIIKPESYMVDPAWSDWSWGAESVDLDDDGNIVALFEEEKYGAFSVHTDKTFNAGTIHFEAMIDKAGAPVKVIVHTTKEEEQVVCETFEDVSTTKLTAYEAKVPAIEDDTYNRISIQDAWGKAITLTINNFYFTPGEAEATTGKKDDDKKDDGKKDDGKKEEGEEEKADSNKYYVIKSGESKLEAKWEDWSWGLDDREFDKEGNYVAHIIAGEYGAVSFKRNDGVKFGKGTLYFKAKVNDTSAQLQVLMHTDSDEDEYYNVGKLKNISDKKLTGYTAKVAPTEIIYDRITIQNVSNKALTLYLNDVYYVDETPKTEKPKNDEDKDCWAAKLGFKCCKTTNYVRYEDDDGKWGVENNFWCGIVEKEEKCWSTRLGYPCCEKSKVVYTVDDDGSWGYEDDHWCGISKADASCKFAAIGYPCCPDNQVVFKDEHKWGVTEDNQWCGVKY